MTPTQRSLHNLTHIIDDEDCCTYVPAISKAIDELTEFKKDAERYRWLRTQHWAGNKVGVVGKPKETVRLGSVCLSEELLDNFIDEEMKNEPQN